MFRASAPKTTRPPGENDDLAGHEGRVFWLFDGATENWPVRRHDRNVQWYVRQLSDIFAATVRAQPDIALADLTRRAIRVAATQFFADTGYGPDTSYRERPFSTLLLCRHDAARAELDYLIIGDSVLAVCGRTETVVTDRRQENLGHHEALYAVQRSGQGISSQAYRDAMDRVYHFVYGKLNQPDGFDVVAQDEDVVSRAVTGTIAADEGDTVLLMSDGYSCAVDVLGLYPDFTAMAAAIDRDGPDAVIAAIRAFEKNDPEGFQKPRQRREDDATVIGFTLG